MDDNSIFEELGLNPQEWEAREMPAIRPGPPALIPDTLEYPKSTLPPTFLSARGNVDSQRPQKGLPVRSLWPIAPSGHPASNAAAAVQAKIYTGPISTFAANQPQISTDTDPTGTQRVSVNPPSVNPRTRVPLPAPPVLSRTIGIIDNLSGGRASIASLIGDTSGDTTTSLIDGGNKRFLHPMMSTGTQAVATSGGSIQNTAPVVGHPSANIGTALQKLNSGGLLLDVDQIAAQGTTHKVVSAIDSNERALIDFTQPGHLSKNLDNIEDTSNYIRHPQFSGQAIVVPNGNFINGTIGWIGARSSISQSSASPVTNGKSLQASMPSGNFPDVLLVEKFKASPGESFYISLSTLGDGNPGSYFVGVIVFDGSGNGLASQAVSNINFTSSWGVSNGTVTMPANTAYFQFLVEREDSNPGTFTINITDVQITRVASLDTEVADGSTFARVVASDQTSNRIDFSKALLNKQLDNIPDGTTYNRLKAANMFDGGILPAHVTGQLASIDLGTITDLTSFISLPPGTGWQLASSLSIDLPNGLNSITFQVHSANIANSGSGTVQVGTASGEGWGLAIYSGAAPSSPSANSNGAITTGSTVTVSNPLGGNVTLGIYIFFTSGTFSGTSSTAKLAIRTVIPVSLAAIT